MAATDQLTLDKNSMFIRTPVYRVDGNVVFGLRREVVPPDNTDVAVEITQANAGRLDLIAAELYGTETLDWVLAEVNQLIDPMTEVVAGTELRAPRRERLFGLLST